MFRKLLLVAILPSLLVLVGVVVGQQTTPKKKVWFEVQGRTGSDFPSEVVFIEDLETGTRCYGLQGVHSTAIHCVPRGK